MRTAKIMQYIWLLLVLILCISTLSACVTGEKGEQGIQGEAGEDGETPYIGENGNWWIGDKDTGISAKGEHNADNGLDYYPLPDGTYGVAVGRAIYLENIVIPERYCGKAVTQIIDIGFNGCANLKTVTIPDSVTSIGESAFSGCASLTSVTIPDSVTSIGERAFYGCGSLNSVTMGNSVTSIGYYAFKDCVSLASVHITDMASWCSIIFNGAPSTNPLYYAHNLYLNGALVTELVIPDGVASIYGSSFIGCTSLTSITIPDSVTSIGHAAFEGCASLTSITIPGSVTSIGHAVFNGCASLTSITIPDVMFIGDGVFENCSSLAGVYYGGSVEKWKNVGSYSPIPTSATLYFYSETQPTDTANKYWHYVNGVLTEW